MILSVIVIVMRHIITLPSDLEKEGCGSRARTRNARPKEKAGGGREKLRKREKKADEKIKSGNRWRCAMYIESVSQHVTEIEYINPREYEIQTSTIQTPESSFFSTTLVVTGGSTQGRQEHTLPR